MRVPLRLIHSAGPHAPTLRRSGICEVLRCAYFSLALAVLMAIPTWSQEAPRDLGNKSIEDLMNIEVTSVSKKEQKLSRTAAAIFVISQEDIRRSGATNIPDLLRMVPGMDVAQVNGNTWAISARGLNDEFNDELLVVVDGRNVYTPTFGGVLWELLDYPFEDIERIEVIRGPGATIWGANAVNGVINIITKKSGETRGAIVVAGGGNVDQGFGTAQFGGNLGGRTGYRVYSKYFNQSNLPDLTGQNGRDGSHILRAGFRTDTTLSAKDTLMFQGDLFTGRERSSVATLASVASPVLLNNFFDAGQSGGFFQAVWNHAYSDRSDSTLNFSYDAYNTANLFGALSERRHTFNVDFEYHIARGERHDIVWGLGYSHSVSRSEGDLTVSFNPADLGIQVFSSFIQDEIALVPDRFYLTVGTKLEHNDYTAFNILPSARATYTPRKQHMLWMAISRAVTTPTRVDTAARFNSPGTPAPDGTPTLVSLFGNPRFKNEDLVAYEGGYRATISNRFSFDFAAFYNQYKHQQTSEPSAPFFETTPIPPHFVLPTTFQNLMYGEAHGLEVSVNWNLTHRWSLSPGYAFERFHMHVTRGSLDTPGVADVGGVDPHLHAQLRSHLELSKKLTWDAAAYFTDRANFQGVPSYTRLDTGLCWKAREGLTLNLVGQNLLNDRHVEFLELVTASRSTQAKRSAYIKLTWQF
jgi:iron complex outermembrane receptor protein